MYVESGNSTEAVMLIEGDIVTRELLFPEFEAFLDGYVSEPHFKGKSVKAVYVVINSSLCITSAVFFVIDFDADGAVNRRWNVPLRALADVAGEGPDLGAGPIRLTCFSQCAIELQRNNLWDPQMEPSHNDFLLLKKTASANRLGLSSKAIAKPQGEDASPAAREPTANDQQQTIKKQFYERYAQELRNRLATELKAQRLRIASLQSNHEAQLKTILQEHQQRVGVYQEALHSLQEQNTELQKHNASIKETLDIQAGKVQGIREYYAHKLKLAQADEASQSHSAQADIDLEVELKVQAATRELTEALDLRNIELLYRQQNEISLNEEIVQLKRQYQELLSSSGEQLLNRLNQAGISLVVFHCGLGQFTLALEDLSQYLQGPEAFAAEKLNISQELYSCWLSHYQTPTCNALDASGHRCANTLSKIDSPLKFHIGESDRCEQHQAVGISRE